MTSFFFFCSYKQLEFSARCLAKCMTFTYHDLDFCQVLPGESRPDRAALVRFASPDEAKWIVERVFPACFDFGDLRSRLTGCFTTAIFFVPGQWRILGSAWSYYSAFGMSSSFPMGSWCG